MPSRPSISVPAPFLALARYAAAMTFPGSTRPSGAGLTGTDLQLWWTLLDLAGDVDDFKILHRDLTAVLGRVHSGRIDAALERLRGTDVIMASFVAPLVVDHSHTDAIAIRLDRRIIDLVRSSRKAKAMIDIKVPPMRALSSRWSAALYGRFLSWENHVYPASPNIRFGAHPRGRAFELDVPTASLPDVFGFDGAMRPFEIANRFITSTPRCPLQRELGKAMVAVDTAVLGSEIAPKGMHGLRIRMSEITTRVVDLAAADKHRSIRRTHRQAIRAI